jgi:hypothetical protein
MGQTLKLLGVAGLVLAASCFAPSAHAVIFYSTNDDAFNTTAPTGTLSGSGWQWVGIWGGYEGTPIGPHHFLTSKHVGGSIGDPLKFGGASYTTTAFFDDATTDLRICEVSGTFPSWAPLYRSSGEVGQGLVVIGIGVGRGAAVVLGGLNKGWMWGSTAGTMHWGQNTISAAIDGGAAWGTLLHALFQGGMGTNEADLAVGDSSSPVFINDGSGWKLAGIAAAVDGPFNTTNSGSGFNAAIYDGRGLYIQGIGGTWNLISGSGPVATGFYATRLSVRASWIDSVVPSGEDYGDSPLLSQREDALLVAVIAAIGAAVSMRIIPIRRAV